MNKNILNEVVLLSSILFVGIFSITYAQPADTLLPADNIFDTLSVDLKVNGGSGPVSVSVGDRITISWTSEGATRCKGNWSKKDLPLNGKISGKLSRSLTSQITVRIACIDADGNRKDDSVVLAISNPSAINTPLTPQPPPPPSDQPIIISSCGEITKSGRYVLDRDVTAIEGTCLNVHDTTNVDIDGKGHTIIGGSFIPIEGDNLLNPNGSAVSFQKVDGFSLKSAILKPKGGYGGQQTLFMRNSKNGNIHDNTFAWAVFGGMNVFESSNLKVFNNAFEGMYSQIWTDNSYLHDNRFAMGSEGKNITLDIVLDRGANNKVERNAIDGGAKGILSEEVGADDGIVIEMGEHDSVISDNTIKNVYDCGIETAGLIKNNRILQNNIKNAGYCGIGGWYVSSLSGNTISFNTVEDTQQLFTFFRVGGLTKKETDRYKPEVITPAEVVIYFSDNVFEGNKFINPRPGNASTRIDVDSAVLNLGENPPPVTNFNRSKNVFKNNDFTIAVGAPSFKPVSMIIDGGGNVCGKAIDSGSVPIPNYPLACGRGQ